MVLFRPLLPSFSSLFSCVACPSCVCVFREVPLNAASIGVGLVVVPLGMSRVGKKKRWCVDVKKKKETPFGRDRFSVCGWLAPTCEQVDGTSGNSLCYRGSLALMGCPVREKRVFSSAPPYPTACTSEPSVWCPRRLLKVDRRVCWKSLWAGPMLCIGEGSPWQCCSREPEVFVCVRSRVYCVFLWAVDFWLNNLRTLFSNCGRAMFFFFFLRCSCAAMSLREWGFYCCQH